jgi:hypothetical protein
VDSSEIIVEITLVFKFGVVVTIDASDVVEILSNVTMDAVDISSVRSDEEIEYSNGISEVDATPIEVGTNDVSASNSVLAVLKIPIVVLLILDIGCNEDDTEYSGEIAMLFTVVAPTLVKSAVLVSDKDRPVIISGLTNDIVVVSEISLPVVRGV